MISVLITYMYVNIYIDIDMLIFEWLCFKEATSVFAYLLKIGWVTHEKII